jgi:hypothetical protein
MSTGNFWTGIAAAQHAAASAKAADRRHRILSIVCGIALALLIGGGLLLAAVRSRSKALVRVVSAIGGGCIQPAGPS